MIKLQGIHKTFRVAKREAGFGRAVKALFSRSYETVHALTDVSFRIREGEMVGYIGPNGAGKSTTIKIMCGVLTPDRGLCDIGGRTPWKERIAHARQIGVVFGQRSQLWWNVPVTDSFELIRSMYKIEAKRYKRNLDELTGLLNLTELLKTPARSLSLGQRMRCEIAASLLHSPRTLFLDEPTIGLDAVSKIAVRQFIQKLNAEQGTTVLPHHARHARTSRPWPSASCSSARGRILLDNSLEEMKRRSSERKTLTVAFGGPPPAPARGHDAGGRAGGAARPCHHPVGPAGVGSHRLPGKPDGTARRVRRRDLRRGDGRGAL